MGLTKAVIRNIVRGSRATSKVSESLSEMFEQAHHEADAEEKALEQLQLEEQQKILWVTQINAAGPQYLQKCAEGAMELIQKK